MSAWEAPVAPRVRRHMAVARREETTQYERHCGDLTTKLEAGGKARCEALEQLSDQIRHLTFEPAGCRVVQLAIEVLDQKDSAELLKELRGHVRRAIASPHGNYVIQKIVEVMPCSDASFVAEELRGYGAETARHRFGCRVLCRLLEHSSSNPAGVDVLKEVLMEAEVLCRDNFGHHVMESVVEHGTAAQKQRVVEALVKQLYLNVGDRNASYVIEAALQHGSPQDQQSLAFALLNHQGGVEALAMNQFGFHIVKTLLRLPGDASKLALNIVQSASQRLQVSKYGARVLECAQGPAVRGGA